MDSSPIIPWMGGKRRLADKLIPLFPPHECYVEVFCGGAALYFLRPVPAQTEVINDINGELVNLYRVVQHHMVEFVQQFKWAISKRPAVPSMNACTSLPYFNFQIGDRHGKRCAQSAVDGSNSTVA